MKRTEADKLHDAQVDGNVQELLSHEITIRTGLQASKVQFTKRSIRFEW